MSLIKETQEQSREGSQTSKTLTLVGYNKYVFIRICKL